MAVPESPNIYYLYIIQLELHIVRYNPLRGETWIPLPKELTNKKTIINVKNKDNKCFLWCVLRALNPKENNAERVNKELKTRENTLNMEGIKYPVSLKDIHEFEKQNPDTKEKAFILLERATIGIGIIIHTTQHLQRFFFIKIC